MVEKYKGQVRNNIGALWIKKSKKDGSNYFAGKITINGVEEEIIVFENTSKTKETHPDYVIRQQMYLN